MARLRMPDGRRLFGANIVPPAADVIPASGQQAWSNLLLNWPTRWPTWIKPQVDYLAGNAVGANCIRMIGAQEGVVNSLFSQDYHDSCIEQLASYCRSLGVHYFLCTGGIQTGLTTAIGSGLTPQQLAAVQATTIRRLSQLDNVVGVDLIQEAQSGSIGNSFLIANIAEVRRLGVTLPLTMSASCVNTAPGTPQPGPQGESWLLNVPDGRMAQYMDFLSLHVYFRALDPSWLDQFVSAFPDLDVIIGEFGRSFADGASLQASDYQRWLSIGSAPARQVRGAICWAASDQNTVSSERWGVYSDTFAARSWMLDVLRQYTGGSVVKNNNARR